MPAYTRKPKHAVARCQIGSCTWKVIKFEIGNEVEFGGWSAERKATQALRQHMKLTHTGKRVKNGIHIVK